MVTRGLRRSEASEMDREISTASVKERIQEVA